MPRSRRERSSPPDTEQDRAALARSFRLRRASGFSEVGDMVIRGRVRARLLGMQILTLDARVVVGTDDGHPAITPSLITSPDAPSGPDPRSSEPGLASAGSEPGLVRAIELLDQGRETLERMAVTKNAPRSMESASGSDSGDSADDFRFA